MFRAGATPHCKARIVKLDNEGRSPEQISAMTRVRLEHVKLIIKQARAGTLRMMGPRGLMPLPTTSDYLHGGPGQEDVPVDQGTAKGVIEAADESRNASLAAENAELAKKIREMEAEAKKPKRRGRPPKTDDGEQAA